MSNSGVINWDDVSARVSAAFTNTGSWGLLDEWLGNSGGPVEPQPPSEPTSIDWAAEAAQVNAYYNATGSWGILTEWLSNNAPAQPDPTPEPNIQKLGTSDDVETAIGTDGPDVFAFGILSGSRGGSFVRLETGVGEGNRDVIVGFQQGKDIIDLSPVNWVSQSQGPAGGPIFPGSDLVFEFIGTNTFTEGGADTPQLRFFNANSLTIIQMDGIRNSDGPPPPDGFADAEILLPSQISLTAADFIL